MIHPRKPVWTEGLFMTPQHLQQADQYHEALVQSRDARRAVLRLGHHGRGSSTSARSPEASCACSSCHGFFGDGTPFFIGDRGEDTVEARPLEGAFPAALEALDVYLAMPHQRDAAANIALDPAKAGPAVRYVATPNTVPDVNTGRNETAITWARAQPASALRHRGARRVRDRAHRPARARPHGRDRAQEERSSPPSCTSACPST
jgi:type VI secretion system protein ImpJ